MSDDSCESAELRRCVCILLLIRCNLAFILAAALLGGVEVVVTWLSGSALVSINVVTLRRAQLILGWVTVCG